MSHATPTDTFYKQLGDIGYEMLLGPYRCWGIVEVYRLAADRQQLNRYVKRVLGDLLKGSEVSVELSTGGSDVYFVHYQVDTLISSRDRGVFNDNSTHFHIPVDVTVSGEQAQIFSQRSPEPLEPGKDGNLKFAASIPVYSYGAHMINVITSNELRGQGMAHAEIRSNQALCLDDFAASSSAKQLVDIRPLMSPPDAPDAGEILRRQSMIQVWNRRPVKPQGSLSADVTKKGSSAVEASTAMTQAPPSNSAALKTVKSKLAGHRLNALLHIFDLLTLKQFPHDRDPDRACYQSIIHVRRRVMIQNRTEKELHKPVFAAEQSFVETLWDSSGKLGPQDPRLRNSCVLINAEHPHADMVKALGLLASSELTLEASGQPTRYYELKPTAYIKMNSDLGEPSVCFEEAQAEAMGYRTNTLGKNNGWLSR